MIPHVYDATINFGCNDKLFEDVESKEKRKMKAPYYMHIETGTVDDREGWEASYTPEELEERRLESPSKAFDYDVRNTLVQLDTDDLDRWQAIALVGLKAVEKLDGIEAKQTGRLLDSGDDRVEWRAELALPDGRFLYAYLYTENEVQTELAEKGHSMKGWRLEDWQVDHYAMSE